MDEEKGRKAVAFVKNLFEFLADPSDLTEEELDDFLRREGVDPDELVSKIIPIITQKKEDQ